MNIIEYTIKQGRTFDEKPFNHMDALVLSQLAYIRFEEAFKAEKCTGAPIKEMFKSEYFSKFFCDGISDKENLDMLGAATASRRYRNVFLKNVTAIADDHSGEQFAAMTFQVDGDTDFIAFRGTDGTLNGWKEDCMLAFTKEIPAQNSAVKYLEDWWIENVLDATSHKESDYNNDGKNVYVGGHSKGGNLAVYASAFCQEQIRDSINSVYSLDGPGFMKDINHEINRVKEKDDLEVIKIVPYGSIVGMLLDNNDDYKVIKSSSVGIMQHSMFSWIIDEEEKDLVYAENLSSSSLYIDRTMGNWLSTATEEQQRTFVEVLFRILEKNNISVVSDFNTMKLKDALQILRDFKDVDEETSKAITELLKALGKSAFLQIKPKEEVTDAISQR